MNPDDFKFFFARALKNVLSQRFSANLSSIGRVTGTPGRNQTTILSRPNNMLIIIMYFSFYSIFFYLTLWVNIRKHYKITKHFTIQHENINVIKIMLHTISFSRSLGSCQTSRGQCHKLRA